MADEDDGSDGDGTGDEGQGERTNAEWATLRKERKKNEKLAEENAALKKASAFQAAGFDTAKLGKLGQLFQDSYTGDLTAEAIKKEALAAGFVDVPDTVAPGDAPDTTAAGVPNPDAAALAAQQRVNAASTGAIIPGGDKVAQAHADLDAAFAAGDVAGLEAKARELGLKVAEQ